MRGMLVLVGLLTVLGGILPLVANYVTLPKYIPTQGPGYQLAITFIGLFAIFYGMRRGKY